MYSGNSWRKEESFFSESLNLGFALNCDGINFFSSGKLSLWPFFLRILNLPSNKRNKPENIIMCALWEGKGHPKNMNILLPIVNFFKNMRSDTKC